MGFDLARRKLQILFRESLLHFERTKESKNIYYIITCGDNSHHIPFKNPKSSRREF